MKRDLESIFDEARRSIRPLVESNEKAEQALLNAMKSFVALNEQQEYTIDKPIALIWCIHRGCKGYLFTIQEFKIKEVVCPHCKNKLRVRCYKNSSVNVSLPKEKKESKNK